MTRSSVRWLEPVPDAPLSAREAEGAGRARGAAQAALEALIGESEAMRRLRTQIARVASSDLPVLVQGPTGAGKELVARAIHAQSERREASLMELDCACLPATLMESTLFGHRRGSFTGAESDQDGYFASVGNGTLLLDEIGELPLGLQSKLLRVLESGSFRAIGSTRELRFTGRLIAATHVDLAARVAAREFREDLFHRVNVLVVRVPPLAERRSDIPLLARFFAARHARPIELTPGSLALLARLDWPGNVRELRNTIDRAAVMADTQVIDTSQLLEILGAPAAGGGSQDHLSALVSSVLARPLEKPLEAIEWMLIDQAMAQEHGNRSAAARLLGIHRKALERRLKVRSRPRAGVVRG